MQQRRSSTPEFKGERARARVLRREMAVSDERLHGVVEHLLDALEPLHPQRAGLGGVVAVRLLGVDVGRLLGIGYEGNRRMSRAARSPQSSTAALQMYLPCASAAS